MIEMNASKAISDRLLHRCREAGCIELCEAIWAIRQFRFGDQFLYCEFDPGVSEFELSVIRHFLEAGGQIGARDAAASFIPWDANVERSIRRIRDSDADGRFETAFATIVLASPGAALDRVRLGCDGAVDSHGGPR